MLDKTKKLDKNTVNLINCFFNQLNAPICLVAHNGDRFDYPLLKRQLKKLVMICSKNFKVFLFSNRFSITFAERIIA